MRQPAFAGSGRVAPWTRWWLPTVAGGIGIATAAGAAWVTLGHILVANPVSALAVGRSSSTILANRSIELLLQRRVDQVRIAEALANRALRKEPSNPRAAVAAALVADLEGRAAARNALLTYEESLSRREFLAELGLIETQVAAGNVAAALVHYNHALTTSKQAGSVLFPILASAAAEPNVAQALAGVLAQRPPWWRQFVEQLNSTGQAPAQMRRIVGALRLDAGDPMERQLLSGTLNRMVELGGYRDSAALYASAMAGRATKGSADFTNAHAVFPFDWMVVEGADVGGYMETGPTGEALLGLRANDGASGVAARRLVLLPAGRYVLQVHYGGVTDNPLARPSVALRCVKSQQALQAFYLPPAAVTGAIARFSGVITGDCAAQWIEIGVIGSASQPHPGWIMSVTASSD